MPDDDGCSEGGEAGAGSTECPRQSAKACEALARTSSLSSSASTFLIGFCDSRRSKKMEYGLPRTHPQQHFLPPCPPNTHAVPSVHTLFHTDKRSTPSVTPTCPLCSLYLPPRFSVSHTHALAHGTPRPDLHFTPVPYTSPDPAPLLRLRPPPRRPPPRTAAPASASPASPPLSPPSASRRWWPSIATTPRSQSATPSRRGPPPRRPSPRRPPPSASCTMSSCAPFSPIATASI